MLKEHLYQIKEVMDKFGISRDTIYHYEKHGLVSLKRGENGYRVFDELNVQKIKKILDLRNLGFSLEEVSAYCSVKDATEKMKILLDLQKKTEVELRELKKRLELIHAQQRHIISASRYEAGFNIDYNISLCENCPRCTPEERHLFYVRDGFRMQTEPDGRIICGEECEIVLQDLMPSYLCHNCDQKAAPYPCVLRGRTFYEDEKELQKAIRDAYMQAEALDYQPKQKIIATIQAPRIDNKEVLTCMLYIPLEHKSI